MPASKPCRFNAPPPAFTYTVGGEAYRIHGVSGSFRLVNQASGRAVYATRHNDGRITCDCSRRGQRGRCKHANLLLAMGCLPEPQPQLNLAAKVA